MIDIFGVLFLLGGLSLSGYMNTIVALGMLVAYLMVTAEVFLSTHAGGVFRISFLKFGPTELRILISIGTIYLLYRPWVHMGPYGPFRLFDVGGVIASIGLMFTLVFSSIRNTRALFKAEPLPSKKIGDKTNADANA